MKEASAETDSSRARDADAIPRLIMLLFVGAFAAGAVIGYFTQGFGFFARSSTPVSITPEKPPVAPAPPPQRTRAMPAPKPAAAPAPVSPSAPAQVTSPEYAAPTKATESSEAPQSVGLPSGDFRVQVGAFRVRKNAEILVSRLEEDGFRAHISYANGLYKVRIGPFASAVDAKRLAKELRGKNYDAFVLP